MDFKIDDCISHLTAEDVYSMCMSFMQIGQLGLKVEPMEHFTKLVFSHAFGIPYEVINVRVNKHEEKRFPFD